MVPEMNAISVENGGLPWKAPEPGQTFEAPNTAR